MSDNEDFAYEDETLMRAQYYSAQCDDKDKQIETLIQERDALRKRTHEIQEVESKKRAQMESELTRLQNLMGEARSRDPKQSYISTAYGANLLSDIENLQTNLQKAIEGLKGCLENAQESAEYNWDSNAGEIRRIARETLAAIQNPEPIENSRTEAEQKVLQAAKRIKLYSGRREGGGRSYRDEHIQQLIERLKELEAVEALEREE